MIWLSHHLNQLFWIKLNEAGIDTYAVGKINDIFNGAGINHDMGHNKSNSHGIDNLIKAMTSEDFKHGFSFTNLVDFDALLWTPS